MRLVEAGVMPPVDGAARASADAAYPGAGAPGEGGLARRTVRGIVWTSLATAMQAGSQLVALVILARFLSPRDFGVLNASLIVLGFSTIFSQLGVGPAIVQRPVLTDRHLRVAFTISLFFSLVTTAAVMLAAPLVAAFFKLPELTRVMRVIALLFVVAGGATVAESLAQRQLRFRWLAGVDVVAFATGFVIVGTSLAWLGYGAWALIDAQLTAGVLRGVILLVGQRHPKRPLLERRVLGELFYFGSGFTLARIGNYLAGQGDNLVVGRCLGAAALGLYGQAYQLMTAPAQLLGQVFDRVLFPAMAQVQLETDRLRHAYSSGVAAVAVVVLPLSVVLAVLAPEIVVVVLGPTWAGVVAPFRIFALGMIFRTSYKISDSLARATGAVFRRAWRQALYAALVVTGAWIGQRWGLAGVALGVLVAIAANFLVMAQLSLRLTGMRWAELAALHVPAVVLAGTLGLLGWLLAAWLRACELGPAFVLFGTTALMAVAAAALCWCQPRLFLGEHGQRLLRLALGSALARPHLISRLGWSTGHA